MTNYLVIGDEGNNRVALDRPRLSVGRNADNDLVIEDDAASGYHANFFKLDGELVVVDTGSSNGTYVNGERLAGRRVLLPNDRVRVGDTLLTVFDPSLRVVTAEQPAVSDEDLARSAAATRVRAAVPEDRGSTVVRAAVPEFASAFVAPTPVAETTEASVFAALPDDRSPMLVQPSVNEQLSEIAARSSHPEPAANEVHKTMPDNRGNTVVRPVIAEHPYDCVASYSGDQTAGPAAGNADSAFSGTAAAETYTRIEPAIDRERFAYVQEIAPQAQAGITSLLSERQERLPRADAPSTGTSTNSQPESETKSGEAIISKEKVEAMVKYAAALAAQGKSKHEIQASLVQEGLEQDAAATIAGGIGNAISEAKHSAGAKNLGLGLLWCIGGIVVTAVTYEMAVSGGGGKYMVAWGAVVFGAVQALIGLFQMATAKSRQG